MLIWGVYTLNFERNHDEYKNLFCSYHLSLSLVISKQAHADAIFDKHCSSCHAGGGNIIKSAKGLDQVSLDANSVNSADKIKALVTNGKAPMPAFGKLLSADDIESVSSFVMKQAKNGRK